MKTLIISCMLATAALGCKAEAGTLNALRTPDNAVPYVGFPSFHACGGEKWNADDTAHGFCYRSKSSACSGRGCQPVVNGEYYDVNWNADGTVASSVLCGTLRHHNPQPNQWTYQVGYDSTTCRGPVTTSPTTTTIDSVSYYDFGASPSGLYELLRGNAGPSIYAF